jgi:putative ubiquitin-RnfH superfamily antitoxin RatB of RatAB toxin-antitoxin module
MTADAPRNGLIRVEVAYALPDEQVIVPLEVPAGTSAEEAIRRSGILERFPDIDLDRQKVGIFSRPVGRGETLHEHDRVEIYRPLQVDPKEMRRSRARAQSRGRGNAD